MRERRWRTHALLFACLIIDGVKGYAVGTGFAVIASPTVSNIYYSMLPSFEDQVLPREERPVYHARILIDGKGSQCTGYGCMVQDRGLRYPESLVVHRSAAGDTLYVADTQAQAIYSYSLIKSPLGTLHAGSQRAVLLNVAAKGLAVDDVGNLFYTTGESNQVDILTWKSLVSSKPTPATLYSGAKSSALSSPSGIVADNFHVYWANAAGDANTGTLIKAPEVVKMDLDQRPLGVQALAGTSDLNQAMVTKVCVARDNVFFTGDSTSLFAVKTRGGTIAEVYSNFSEPTGCAYDGAGSLFVADAGRDAVYSLPANFASLRAVRYAVQAISVKAPSDVAILAADTLRAGAAKWAPFGGWLVAALCWSSAVF